MQNTIEQQLYNPATPYEKMLSNCVRLLFDFEFIVATMNDKSGLKSIEQIAGHYEIAFDNWQIELHEPAKREIKHRRTMIWSSESARARQQLTTMKVQ